jgi:hypothetical protein
MARQERFKKCTRCNRHNISPFVKGTVCGECQALDIIGEIRYGRIAEETVLRPD